MYMMTPSFYFTFQVWISTCKRTLECNVSDALLWLETNETRQSSVLRVCIANPKSTTMLWAVRVWKVTPSLPLISNVKPEHTDRGFELWLYSRYRHRG